MIWLNRLVGRVGQDTETTSSRCWVWKEKPPWSQVPIFPCDGRKSQCEAAKIVRFPSHVKWTVTDADGKPDLVKPLFSHPKAVAQGDFKAATILETPLAGTLGN